MSNFLFNTVKVAMADGSGGFDWLNDDVVGVLFDNRLTPTPDMDWTDVASYEVATSPPMAGRVLTPDGRLVGDTLPFLSVTTEPGLKIKGLILKFVTTDQLIVSLTEGLDGFSGNPDLALEANDLDIYARTSAASQSTWIAL